MSFTQFARAASGFAMCVAALSAQTPAGVDFARDVAPVFRRNCVGCHGAAQQQGGMRLDRKSSVVRPFSRRVVPGSSANSFVYLRIAGPEFGMRMPPTGPMRTEEIAVVKAWIDQGAVWPDSLANEVELPPLNPKAIAMVESLRTGDMAAFMKSAAADPPLLNARGPEGSTPFMYAVLYADAPALARMLKLGADPNKHNDAHATALMWAAKDLEKTRLLLGHGADVNAKSDDSRTPLMIAARRAGNVAAVKLLLDRGAKPNPNAKPEAESSPLLEALAAGDAAIVSLLAERGADAKAAGQTGLSLAVMNKCARCIELLAAKITDKAAYTGSLQDIAVLGDVKAIRLMLDRGADVNAYDPFGRTALMYAAISDLLPVDVVKLLIERGADVNAVVKHPNSGDTGWTVLDIARRNGDTPIAGLLVKAGAKASPYVPVALTPKRENTIRDAVQDSLAPLQEADAKFTANAGCVSCHNDSLQAMTLGLARKRGFHIDEKTAAAQTRTNAQFLEKHRDHFHQGFVLPVADTFSSGIISYILLGLHAEGYPADLNTGAAAMHILWAQNPAGNWPLPPADTRPPLCHNYIGQTALSLRALQLYAPQPGKQAYDRAIRLAGAWLAKAPAYNNDDRSWRVAGLAWWGADKTATQKAMSELLAAQRSDGGWSDVPSLESAAYATGKSLVALQAAGLPVSDAAYQRGLKFLLSTQQQDGSWYVRTRALGFQPYFDAGFPYGYDQWISAAGTSWAAMALTLALPETPPLQAFRLPR